MEPKAKEPWIRSSTLALAVLVAGLGALLPFLPEEYRLWNYAAFGAVGLFTAARAGRFGLIAGLILGVGSKLPSDLIAYVRSGYNTDYELSPVVYSCLAGYALVGWLMLRRSSNPLRIGLATFLASLQFYLVTNLVSWQRFDLPYDRSILGLFESYWMALPFFRGTIISDFTFTGTLFLLNYAWAWAVAPKPKLAVVTVQGNLE